MQRSRPSIAISLCCTYFILAGLIPVIGLHHDIDIGADGTSHHAIDTCTWVQHAIGSSLFSGAATDLTILASYACEPHTRDQRVTPIHPDSIQARAPPASLS